MKSKIQELSGRIDELRKQLAQIFEEAGDSLDMSKVTCIEGDSQAKVEKIREINRELDDLTAELEKLRSDESEVAKAYERFRELDELQPHPGHPTKGREQRERKSFVDQLFDSPAIKERRGPVGPEVEIQLPEVKQLAPIRQQLKTLFQTTDGWEPESIRSGRVDLSPQEAPSVTSLVPMLPISQPLYKFMRETVFSNTASETAEGGAYHEAELQLAEAEEAVRKLTVWIPVTDEQLEDVPAARAYVESRLRFMLEQRLDQRLLTGNPAATPPQIRGFHNTTGINNYARQPGEPVPDAIYRAMTLIRVNGQDRADAVVMNPLDWQEIRLLRTNDGIYIWGSPSEVAPQRIWGLPVVDTTHEAQGQALTGAFGNQSLLVVRRGVTVQVTNSHEDDFVHGRQAIRADFRCALVTIRPQAFSEVDLTEA